MVSRFAINEVHLLHSPIFLKNSHDAMKVIRYKELEHTNENVNERKIKKMLPNKIKILGLRQKQNSSLFSKSFKGLLLHQALFDLPPSWENEYLDARQRLLEACIIVCCSEVELRKLLHSRSYRDKSV